MQPRSQGVLTSYADNEAVTLGTRLQDMMTGDARCVTGKSRQKLDLIQVSSSDLSTKTGQNERGK